MIRATQGLLLVFSVFSVFSVLKAFEFLRDVHTVKSFNTENTEGTEKTLRLDDRLAVTEEDYNRARIEFSERAASTSRIRCET